MDTSVFTWWGAYDVKMPDLIAQPSAEEKASAQYGRYEEMKIKYGNRVQFIIELLLGILLLMIIYTFGMPTPSATTTAIKRIGGGGRKYFTKLFL